MATDVPSISEWFRDRNVFVTGGTGFMGKLLVYKLLVSCHDLGKVFLLTREKRGVDPQTRLNLMIQQEPLSTIKEKYPERLKKIVLVIGNISTDGLSLSASDKAQLLREVSVVFHMAANVKFDLTLKEAVKTNTEGTLNILNMARQMTQLKSFIHVSTSYSQCDEVVLEEKAYPTLMMPEDVLHTVNNLPDDILQVMRSKIVGNQPNTYSFSKALGEDLVTRSGLPSGIARPSIVTATWKEPVEGWVENMNGPTGIMIGAGKGVIRTFLCDYNSFVDFIPCDIAINVLIALAWKVGRENPTKTIFTNVTGGKENPITWGYAIDTGRKHTLKNPFTGILWYPGGSITSWKFYHWFRVIFFQLLPAYFLDIIISLTGNKPFLIRVQQKILNGFELLTYYTTRQWEFLNDGMRNLQLEMSPADREVFFIDTKDICWDDYILKYILGTRKYCLKDDPSTLPRARKTLLYLYYTDLILKIAFFVFVSWFLYSWINPYREEITTVFEADEI